MGHHAVILCSCLNFFLSYQQLNGFDKAKEIFLSMKVTIPATPGIIWLSFIVTLKRHKRVFTVPELNCGADLAEFEELRREVVPDEATGIRVRRIGYFSYM